LEFRSCRLSSFGWRPWFQLGHSIGERPRDLGYPTREKACRAAELAARALREQGEVVELVLDPGGENAAA
jgi:hypothetical protein